MSSENTHDVVCNINIKHIIQQISKHKKFVVKIKKKENYGSENKLVDVYGDADLGSSVNVVDIVFFLFTLRRLLNEIITARKLLNGSK